MNNRTAHILFRVTVDKNALGVAYGGSPAFLPQEEDFFLNLAQNEIVSNKISGNNALRQGFEGSLQSISELDCLVRTDYNLIASNSMYNEFVIDDVHKDGQRMTILSAVIMFKGASTNCTITDHVNANLYKLTYNNIPWVEVPVAIVEDNKLKIYVDPMLQITDGYNPSNNKYAVNITYIKKPKQFDYTQLDEELDLPDDVMEQVINRAAVLALENIESQRTSGKLLLNQLAD